MDTLSIVPVQKNKLSTQVEKELEELIRRNHFQAGDQLPSERELMGLFQVGRPSVREALAGLQRKGYVQLKNGERARVTKPCFDNLIADFSGVAFDLLQQPGGMQDFEQVRIFIEQGLARQAATRATEEQLKELQQALLANKNAIGDSKKFIITDMAFHRTLVNFSENKVLIYAFQALLLWMIDSRKENMLKQEMRRDYKEHENMYQAILSGNPELSSQMVTKHLSRWVGEAPEPLK